MATIKLENLNKLYGSAVHAVKNIDLEIMDQEFIVLVGPSGCGKSTILRMIAGLEEISAGQLFINEQLMNDVPSKNRNIAMVFQNYALYPYMTVYDNMAFSLKMRRFDKNEIRQKVEEAAQILDITSLLKRKPSELSGGQKQRVALGRSIVRHADVFLMDEPLSNLDAKLRTKMRTEIIKLHNDLKTTTIYVTHDQVEAMTMASRIVVLNFGVVQQIGTPEKIYQQPANIFVANFMGSPPMNFIHGRVEQNQFVCPSGEKIDIPNAYRKKLAEHFPNGGEVVLGIRPEHVQVQKCNSNVGSTILLKENTGSEQMLHFQLYGQDFIAKTSTQVSYYRGDSVNVHFDENQIHFFDHKTTLNIYAWEGDEIVDDQAKEK